MKILVDMCLSPEWAPFFQNAGIESQHWTSVGKPSDPDTKIFDYAVDHGYVVFTHDLDFGTLLAFRRTRQPSVIQIRARTLLPEDIGDLVLRALHSAAESLESGALVTVDVRRSRVRLLPI